MQSKPKGSFNKKRHNRNIKAAKTVPKKLKYDKAHFWLYIQ